MVLCFFSPELTIVEKFNSDQNKGFICPTLSCRTLRFSRLCPPSRTASKRIIVNWKFIRTGVDGNKHYSGGGGGGGLSNHRVGCLK